MQRASLRDGELGLVRVLDGQRKGSLRKLMPLLVGCLVSYAALTGSGTYGELLDHLWADVALFESATGVPFGERVRTRLREWGVA